MAGNYPDAPSWRMAWDRDGSQGFIISSTNAITQLTSAQMITLNNESDDTILAASTNVSGSCVVIFPELRDLDGFFMNVSGGPQSPVVQVSADTTNGVDGTWTQISSTGFPTGTTKPTMRTGIVSTTSLNVKAVKFRVTNGPSNQWFIHSLHLYGEPVPGANPNRLELWHPTLDQKLTPAHLDWGDVPRGSSADRQVRVKNLSPSQTAGAVRVAMEALTDATPSVPAQHTLSHNGSAFLAQVNVGDLAPGAISTPVTVRRVTPTNATLGLWTFRLFAESGAWS